MYKDEKYKYEVYMTYSENEGGGEPLSNEPYSSRSDGWREFYPKKLYTQVNKDQSYWVETIYAEFDPNDYMGKNVYVVVARYSTGDTFGHSTGHWFVEGVYNDKDEAKKVSDSIRTDDYDGYKPWKGYFESLEDVEIHKFILQGEYDSDEEEGSKVSFYDHSF